MDILTECLQGLDATVVEVKKAAPAAVVDELLDPIVEDGLEEDHDFTKVVEAELDAQAKLVVSEQAYNLFVGLAGMYDQISVLAGDTGLTQREALLAQASLQNLVPEHTFLNDVMATQGWGTASTRNEATETSLQAIGERLSRVWQIMLNGMQRAIAAVMNLWHAIFGSLPQLEKKLESTMTAVEAMKTSKPKLAEKTLTFTGASTLAYKGKMDPTSVRTGINETAVVYKAVVESTGQVTSELSKLSTTVTSVMGLSEEELKSRFGDVSGNLAAAMGAIDEPKLPAINREMSGGNILVLHGTGEGNKTAKVKVSKVEGGAGQGAQTADAWGHDDVLRVLKDAKALLEVVSQNQDIPAKIKKAKDAATKEADKLVKTFDKGTLAKWWTRQRVNSILATITSNRYAYIDNVGTHSYNVVRTAVNASLMCTRNFVADDAGK